MFITHAEKITLQADVAHLKKIFKELQVEVNAMQANIMTLNLGRSVKIVSPPKKRGRPVGSTKKVTK